MLTKKGVDVSQLKPLICKILDALESMSKFRSLSELTITSTYEGKHCATSMYSHHLAFHIGLGPPPKNVYHVIRAALPLAYNVVLKADHIHIEHNPK